MSLADGNSGFAEFHAFTPAHALSVAVCVAITLAFILVGKSAQRRGGDGTVTRLWAFAGVAINIWSFAYWLAPVRFRVEESLPLQLCDMACLVAPLSFLTHRRIFRTLIVFWGLGLSTQAFITPTVPEGFPSQRFLIFWLLHTMIAASALYQVLVRRYRPTFTDCLWAIGVSAVWCYSMFGLNLILDSNYGYVGRGKPGHPTIVDLLGPWPGRVFILSWLVISLFVVLWAVLRDRAPRSGS